MKMKSLLELASFGVKTVIFKKKDPILGTLAYIDKMWGIMKDEDFPSEIRL